MRLDIAGYGWTAECLITDYAVKEPEYSGGFIQFEATVDGQSEGFALKGAQFLLELFGRGRLTVIRANPEAISEKDFDTQIVHHRGYVRFSYLDEGKERWQNWSAAPALPSFGEQVL